MPNAARNKIAANPMIAGRLVRDVLSTTTKLARSRNAASVHSKNGRRPDGIPVLKNGERPLVFPVVVSVRTLDEVPAPGETEAGTKPTVVSGGRPEFVPDIESATVPGKFPFTPDTLMVNIAACPAVMVIAFEAFATEKSVMMKLTELEAPPPGAGFVTTTAALPDAATSDARIAAVTCVALTNVVVLLAPAKLTTAPLTKPVPFTVRVNAAEPAVVVLGTSGATITGTGFGATTLKLTELEAPPPGAGFVTTTAGVLTVVTSVARIAAVTCVALTKVVTLLLPPKLTTAPLTKPVPLIVSVKAPEFVATEAGTSGGVITGTGLFTAKLTEFDAPPAGAGFVTTTARVPVVAISVARTAIVT